MKVKYQEEKKQDPREQKRETSLNPMIRKTSILGHVLF